MQLSSVAVQVRKRAGYYPRLLPLLVALAGVRVDHQLLSYPGALHPRKNRDEFINATVRVRLSNQIFESPGLTVLGTDKKVMV